MPKAKPYSGPVEENVARQLLNSTGHSVDINGQQLLLGDALIAAAKQLKGLISTSNEKLEDNEFTKIVADYLAASMGRRGAAEIAVTDSGSVQLYINHEGNPRTLARKPQRKRKLPLMAELKKRAKKLGVEIPEELGIKRSKIVEYLDQVENGDAKPKKVKAKKAQSAPPKKKATVQTADDKSEPDPGPMSAGPDETKVSSPLDEAKPPKKRGFVKTSDALSGPVVVGAEAVGEAPTEPKPKPKPKAAKSSPDSAPKGKGRNLRQLAQDSKDVDISDLLASDPPK